MTRRCSKCYLFISFPDLYRCLDEHFLPLLNFLCRKVGIENCKNRGHIFISRTRRDDEMIGPRTCLCLFIDQSCAERKAEELRFTYVQHPDERKGTYRVHHPFVHISKVHESKRFPYISYGDRPRREQSIQTEI